MTGCDCVRRYGDICPRCESAAESRKADREYNGESDAWQAGQTRYEHWLDQIGGSAPW